ncbi:MAG: hypothetical protein QHH27_03050 [Clostridia bacterium]|jgi:photosystem II stability/assembly factor-like uncharacterized protein|nr:hypothetical protein [Clostridia bacterium]MDH7572514.1 hypothetical protein [Clostridia bacterium]
MNGVQRVLLSGVILAIGASSFACHARDDNPARPEAGTRATWSEGEQAAAQGENPYLALHSLEFIEANTGWVAAEDRSSPPGQGSQILRTLDGGAHWEKAAELKDTAVHRLRFVDRTTGWALAESGGQNSKAQAGMVKLLHTEDGGQTWEAQWEETSTNLPAGYDLWFQDATQGYALLNGRLLATRDGGKQWFSLSFGVAGFVPQHLAFVNPATGWVIGVVPGKESSKAAEGREDKVVVLRTADGGKHWQEQFAQGHPDGQGGSIDICFVDASTGWFLTSNLATWAGELYYTANGGEDWEKINEIKCVRPTPTQVRFVTSQVGWIPLDVGAGPIAGGLLLTLDGGNTFARVESAGESLREVVFVSARQGWAVGTAPDYGDYLIRTTDGGRSWTKVFP